MESRTSGLLASNKHSKTDCPRLPLSHFLKEPANGFNPVMEVWNVKLFVGSVQIVIGQAEAHHDAGDLQTILKVSDNGNRTTAADEYGFLLEGIA